MLTNNIEGVDNSIFKKKNIYFDIMSTLLHFSKITVEIKGLVFLHTTGFFDNSFQKKG